MVVDPVTIKAFLSVIAVLVALGIGAAAIFLIHKRF